ncbi:MAG TPA: glycoside hydrolase family 15 protein [Rhodocyclaceae bacterium]
MPSSNAAVLDRLNSCDYEPIAHYAAIGDCGSIALVSRLGSIDWLCWPDFSSPSLFAALLDRRRGGRFMIVPRQIERIERRYVGRSAVLETTFQCAGGALQLTDFMPMPAPGGDAPRRLHRRAECLSGNVRVDVVFQPRPDYARGSPRIARFGDTGWSTEGGGCATVLLTGGALEPAEAEGVVGGVCDLSVGQQQQFVLAHAADMAMLRDERFEPNRRGEEDTVAWWEDWCRQGDFRGFHPDAVMRGCLTLKLLTSAATGAVIAAATTSLPESLSAPRNWDYRYCWLRDTSLLLQSFVDIGFERESEGFLGWLLHVGRKPRLQPFYDLHGKPVPDEIELSHLEGYRGVGPVRIGNSANNQLQLDIYGEIVQTAHRFVARGGQLNDDEKAMLAGLGQAVCQLWRQPDQSIWESRQAPRHYTYSKLMCWVALDRLVTLGRQTGMKIDEAQFTGERERIRRDIEAHGFNAQLGSYVGYFGGDEPDASVLLMARYGYLPANDPRMLGTYRHIMSRLAVDGVIYRYPPGRHYDGVAGSESPFLVCNFWVADYLARSGQAEQAAKLFERLLGFGNDLGLYSEQFDTRAGEALGNFPQAYTHSGLVTAAMAIAKALAGKRGKQIPT